MTSTITVERVSDYVNETRRLFALSENFDRTLCYATRREMRRLRYELSIKAGSLAADLAADLAAELPPLCPKCNVPMQGGAPHGPWPVQWECRHCGTVVVPQSSELVEGGVA